jgi:hypothetical protein
MKIDLSLPYAFKARPKGCRDVRNVFLAKSVQVDVPQVSESDTGIVFRFADRKPAVMEQRRDVPSDARFEAAYSSHETAFEMRSYNGELYRKVAGSVSEAEKIGLFTSPFERIDTGRRDTSYGINRQWECDFGADISPARIFADNGPLARPLMEEMTWIMDRASPHCDGSRKAWPPRRSGDMGVRSYHSHRNAFRFEDHFATMADIDWETLALADEMVDIQSKRLLMIGREVWIKSRPPVIAVDHEWQYNKRDDVHIKLVTAPETYVSKLKCAHFSLSDVDVARQYALSIRRTETRTIDAVGELDCDVSMFDYDWRSEAVNRFGYTAAVESFLYLSRNPEKADKLSSEQHDLLAKAFDETAAVNHLLGVHRDMSAYVPDLAAIWKRLSWKQCLPVCISYAGMVEPAAAFALRCIDESPISLLDTRFGTGLAV